MEQANHIKELLNKYLDKKISREEYDVLLQYFGKPENESELDGLIHNALSEDIPVNDNNIEVNKIVNSVEHKLRQMLQPRKTVPLRKYFLQAAVLFLVAVAGISLYIIRAHENEKEQQQIIVDVKPGHSAATLTLANGQKILLNDVANGNIAKVGGIRVSKSSYGEIIYTSGQSDTESNNQINTLSTAKGETYRIVLSDGTKVWLNAATTLQYSADLRAQGIRKVKLLTGEAYFEVSKDKQHPFVVETAKQKVEVLGTHFSINSYQDEGYTTTTLEEGSVRVSSSQGAKANNTATLKPGQQSLNSSGNIIVRQADLQSALAWKEGNLYFKDATIQEVLRQVSRWYNISVDYQGAPSKERFTGGIKRTSNLTAVLRILELSNVNFTLTKNNNTTILVVR
ncbi:hypothetical protein ATE47_01385 [Chryseobacterium sp. IHB B 17019]|uniref:FecR family protein n=1 Tax=Chryseobacterium sp. IHB B 17019 TaxID=1721091 RepID=UPI0007216B38|nr:FecR family protein [Chryseobacterium sp. IHB B 17019]ALR29265.1 hypothetical protein ATE47_01385 [Chryseobacterium sp. IHB B 17019]